MIKYASIAQRLRQYGENNFKSMAELSRALGMSPQSLNMYLSGSSRPGGILQGRLREIGCDITWLMTGTTKEEASNKQKTLISYSGKPSPEIRKRIERLAEWMSKASEEDTKMLEQVARKILKGDEQ